MSEIPVGFLFGAVAAATIACLALWPIPRPGPRMTPSMVLGMSGRELPFLFLAINLFSIAAMSSGSGTSPTGRTDGLTYSTSTGRARLSRRRAFWSSCTATASSADARARRRDCCWSASPRTADSA